MPEVSIVIPTYNEAENVERLVQAVSKLEVDAEIIIVDDNSPDGTGDIAEGLKKDYPYLEVIHRKERGLASAVVEGFKSSRGDIIGVMDSDLSHPPETIPLLIKPLKDGSAELVLGSRYVRGGEIVGWNLLRKITSRGAVLLARPLTNVKDCVTGFFFFKRSVIEGVDLNPRGYKIGLEVIVKGRYKKALEIPFTFTNRVVGKSKLNLKEYVNYLDHLSRLYIYKTRKALS
ncbi:MAG: polyprenol monophosphomannose synthase [Candidatus Hodarchaeales archaeon]|jgi:dolichol-phosphate mannosyltransferase